jgi:hypothetical protein
MSMMRHGLQENDEQAMRRLRHRRRRTPKTAAGSSIADINRQSHQGTS